MKLYFAGAESSWKKLYDNGVRRMLLSYYYLRERKALLDKIPEDVELFLDSGAFTFLKKKASEQELEEYFEDYMKFLHQYKQRFAAITELDVPVDYELRKSWQDRLLGLQTSVVLVWHPSDGIDRFYEFAEKSGYLGVGSDYALVADTIQRKAWNYKLHSYGNVSYGLLLSYSLYSADATSWNSGGKYGQLWAFVGKDMHTCLKEDIEKFRGHFVSIGCSYEKLRDADTDEMDKANILAFLAMEKVVDEHWARALAPLSDSSKQLTITEEGVVYCEKCIVSKSCPKFEAGKSCVFNFKPFGVESLPKILQDIFILQAERVLRGAFVEKLEGGMTSGALSDEIKLLYDLARTLKEISEKTDSVSITAKGGGIDIIRSIFGKG